MFGLPGIGVGLASKLGQSVGAAMGAGQSAPSPDKPASGWMGLAQKAQAPQAPAIPPTMGGGIGGMLGQKMQQPPLTSGATSILPTPGEGSVPKPVGFPGSYQMPMSLGDIFGRKPQTQFTGASVPQGQMWGGGNLWQTLLARLMQEQPPPPGWQPPPPDPNGLIRM